MLLRLGCSLVGWMVVYAYCLWLATLRVVGCGPDGDEFWRVLLGFAPIAAAFSALLGVSAALPSLHQILRWGIAPLLLLIPLGLLPVWSTFETVNLQGTAICEPGAAAGWHLWWAPTQIACLVAICWFSYRAWRRKAPQL